jgi:hypothetical protein
LITNYNLGEKELSKKIMVILVVLGIILSGLAVASGESVTKIHKISETDEVISEKKDDILTITLLKHEFDGSKTPIEIEIEPEEGKDLGELIEEKCMELLEEDPFIKSLEEDENITQEFFMKIRSRGRGLHLRFNSRVQFFKLYKLFPFLPPYFRTLYIVPLLICQYKRDNKAFTTLEPLRSNTTVNSTLITGRHRVISIGFYGISWWVGKVSMIGFVLRNGFVGISLMTRIKML